MLPLFKPYMPELPKLQDIIHSGSLAYGEYTKQFEEKLKSYLGTPYIVVTNSFNTAIAVAMTSAGVKVGSEVIASPMACLASTQPYLSSGYKVKWCDIDPETGTIDPDSLKKSITSKTKVVVHNHFCGYPGYVDEINRIAKENGLLVVDDGIECFGSEYKGKKIGNCGTDITVFSFTAVRMPNTIDGGAIVFNNKELYQKSILTRDCGIDRSRFRDDLGEINCDYDINQIGYSATMSNVNGYIGLSQMDNIQARIDQQRENARVLGDIITENNDGRIISTCNGRPNYWVYGILCEKKRDSIVHYREKGLYASGVHMMNSLYSAFGPYKKLLGVEKFYSQFVALPSGWWINSEQYRELLL